MTEDSIRKYATLMKELELTGLEVNEDGCTVRLERGQANAVVTSVAVPPEKETDTAPADDAGDILTSPMVGVFYTSPAENAEPYVTEGKKVRKGDVLCLIEAMQLMNEITAEYDGIVEEVLERNASVVGFGTPLFRIRRV